ncbi:MAG: tyrosine-type recombinase/integrase [Spirochaetales bacterium]|nr:tyrosine-type recombinase/integrase [Spirochaetales bacterium]
MRHRKVEELIQVILKKLGELSYSSETIKLYRRNHFKKIINYFKSKGQDYFDDNLIKCYIEKVNKQQQSKKFSKRYCNGLRRVAYLLMDYNVSDNPPWRVYGSNKKYVPSASYTCILSKILDSTDLKKEFKYRISCILRKFCCYLEKKNISSFSSLTIKDVMAFLKAVHESNRRSMDYVLYSLRLLFKYLKERNICEIPLELSIFKPVKRGQKVLPVFSKEEFGSILRHIDKYTDIGKRDYAILLLTATTGMRGSDILNLKLSDIDWRKYELSFIQGKTNHRVLLPIGGAAGNAIAEYILHGRPQTDSSNVFIKKCAPYTKIKGTSTLDAMLRKYCAFAGIEEKGKRGFHGIRRSIGSWMVNGGVSLYTVSQVLGHKEVSSAKRYISADESFAACSLNFEGIPVKSEVYR